MSLPLPSPSVQPLILTLLDITPMMNALHGVVMELQDCAMTLVKGQTHQQTRFIPRLPSKAQEVELLFLQVT